MSYFWTNISLFRNDLLVIGYQDGKRFMNRVPARPHLYVDDKTGTSEFRTLTGSRVKRIEFDNLIQIMKYTWF